MQPFNLRFPLLAAALLADCVYGQGPVKLSLADAEQTALKNNPRVASAALTANAAAQVTAEVRSGFQPAVIGNFTGAAADGGSRLAAGGLNNPSVYSRIGSGLAFQQLITDFGRTGSLTQSARLRAEAENQNSESTRADVLLNVDRAYYSLLRARAVQQVAEKTVAARQLLSDQVTALAKANLKSTLDVSFANVNLADARLMLSAAQNGVKAAQADLAAAMGVNDNREYLVADEPLPDSLPTAFDPLLEEAIRQRPELKSLRFREESARRFVEAERALWYPTFGLIGAAGVAPVGDRQVPDKYGAVALNVTIPVFNGGLFKARRSEAEYRAQAAQKDVDDLATRVARDVRVAYLNAMTAFERLGLTEQFLQQAKLALELARTRYDLGLSSIIELSQAELNLTSAEIASSSARYDYQLQRSVLRYQTGNLR